MRWMRFEHGGGERLGWIEDGRIQPVAARSMHEVIRGEGADPAPIREARPLAPSGPAR